MKVTVSEMGHEDTQGDVAGLRARAYPQFPWVAREADFFESLYRWYSTHPLAGGMKRWISVTEEGEVVGHLAAFPQYYRILGQRVVAHTPGDFMVHPDYGFQAFSLMRRFFSSVENCVACDMVPAVISVETRLGAEVAGELRYAAKLLDVSRLPAPRVPHRLQRALGLPEYLAFERNDGEGGDVISEGYSPDGARLSTIPMRPRAPIPTRLRKALDRGLAKADEALGSRYGGVGEVEELDGFDEAFDAFFEKVAAIVPCVPEKDAAFLSWRYGPESLQHPVTVLGVKDRHGALLGYAVLMLSAESPDGFIVDLTTIPGYRQTARALLRGVVRHFRRQGAHIIRYRFSESPASPRAEDLRNLGFLYRKGRGNSLLVKLSEPGLHEAGRELSNWAYNVGDGEATFWMR